METGRVTILFRRVRESYNTISSRDDAAGTKYHTVTRSAGGGTRKTCTIVGKKKKKCIYVHYYFFKYFIISLNALGPRSY